jgi:hypothetical protein
MKAHTKIVETRPKTYSPRAVANPRERLKANEKPKPCPGGTGEEIVRMLKLCRACAGR